MYESSINELHTRGHDSIWLGKVLLWSKTKNFYHDNIPTYHIGL